MNKLAILFGVSFLLIACETYDPDNFNPWTMYMTKEDCAAKNWEWKLQGTGHESGAQLPVCKKPGSTFVIN